MKALATIVLFLGLLWPGGAAAARLALVIGIDDYDNITPLSKAVGDAEAMAVTLSGLGFEVTKVLNPDRRTLNQAVTAFRRALKPGDAALVHFSGHGVEVKGHNLLLPSDIPATPAGEEDYLIEEAIDLGGLIDRVSDSGATVRIFIIDACRSNPIDSLGERGLNRLDGLAPLDPPKGSFVLYSAASRQAALDELGPDDPSPTSVYTRVLLSKLKQPGLTLSQIAREVRVEVAALAVTVGRVQSPAYYDELNEEFILSPLESESDVVPERPTADDAEAFALAKSFNSVAAWEAFLKTYKTGFYADMARVALDQLIQEQAPGASAEFALAVEFEGDVPKSFPVLTFTERANTSDCTGNPCGRSSVKRQIVSLTSAKGATLMVPMPETATRVCVIMEDDSAAIASASLVTPSDGTFSSAKGGDLDANGKSACSFWMADAKAASKWVLTLKRSDSPAANTENFAFAVEAEAGLDLVIRGYGSGDVPFFEERVDTRETYRSAPHYIVRVDEDVIFSNRLLRVCVEDLTGKWSLIPAGGKGEVCDDRPVDNRGTYAFVGRTFPAAPVGPGATLFDATTSAGLVATFDFPIAGTIVGWELFFAFSTECENDGYAEVISPGGRRLIVMTPGPEKHKCGSRQTWQSQNDNDAGAFVGSEARGDWKFVIKDMSKDSQPESLTAVWMKLSVSRNGVVTEHKVSLDGLPREIPSPS